MQPQSDCAEKKVQSVLLADRAEVVVLWYQTRYPPELGPVGSVVHLSSDQG